MTERFELVEFVETIEAIQRDILSESKSVPAEWLATPSEEVNPHLKRAVESLAPVLDALKSALVANDAWIARQIE